MISRCRLWLSLVAQLPHFVTLTATTVRLTFMPRQLWIPILCMRWLLTAFQQAFSSPEVIDALHNAILSRETQGVAGGIRFDSNGDRISGLSVVNLQLRWVQRRLGVELTNQVAEFDEVGLYDSQAAKPLFFHPLGL